MAAHSCPRFLFLEVVANRMMAKGAANGRLTPGLGSENTVTKRPSWPYQFRCLHQLAPWPNQIASADTESFSQSKRVAVTTSSSSKLAIQLFKCFLHGGDCRLWVIGSQVLVLENRDKDLAPYGAVHLNTTNFVQLFKFDHFPYPSLGNTPFNNMNLF